MSFRADLDSSPALEFPLAPMSDTPTLKVILSVIESPSQLQALLDGADPNLPLNVVAFNINAAKFDTFVLLMNHTNRMKKLHLKVHYRWIEELNRRQSVETRFAGLLEDLNLHVAYDEYTPDAPREVVASLKDLFHGGLPSLTALVLHSEIDMDGYIPTPRLRTLDIGLRSNPPTSMYEGCFAHAFDARGLTESLKNMPQLDSLHLDQGFTVDELVYLPSLKEFHYFGSAAEFPSILQWSSCLRLAPTSPLSWMPTSLASL